MNPKELFASFGPSINQVPNSEKILSALGAAIGMLLLGESLRLLPDGGHPLILFGSMAATSLLLYATPHSPMVQPWSLLAGNLLSGAVGGLCGLLITDPVMAVACAVGLSIFIMQSTYSLHPPAAATAMIMVLNAAQIQHYGWLWAAGALLANATICLLLALAINNLIKLGRYPVLHQVLPTHRDGISEDKLAKEDITWALGKMQGFVDADEEDLLEIYRLAIVHSRGSRLLRNQYRGPA